MALTQDKRDVFTAAQMKAALESGDMNDGTIPVTHFPVIQWEFVAAALAAFAFCYLLDIKILRQRYIDTVLHEE